MYLYHSSLNSFQLRDRNIPSSLVTKLFSAIGIGIYHNHSSPDSYQLEGLEYTINTLHVTLIVKRCFIFYTLLFSQCVQRKTMGIYHYHSSPDLSAVWMGICHYHSSPDSYQLYRDGNIPASLFTRLLSAVGMGIYLHHSSPDSCQLYGWEYTVITLHQILLSYRNSGIGIYCTITTFHLTLISYRDGNTPSSLFTRLFSAIGMGIHLYHSSSALISCRDGNKPCHSTLDSHRQNMQYIRMGIYVPSSLFTRLLLAEEMGIFLHYSSPDSYQIKGDSVGEFTFLYHYIHITSPLFHWTLLWIELPNIFPPAKYMGKYFLHSSSSTHHLKRYWNV
jgi:hypothetical protein